VSPEKARNTITILGIPGSLRKGSYNKAMLRAAQELAPAEVELTIFDLDGIPLFNQDTENQPPPRVSEFKSKIRRADAILFSTPQYSKSIPGVLKNALDWGVRPEGDNAFDGKPAAIVSASTGRFGGALAQYHLRQILVDLNVHPVNDPEVFVSMAPRGFAAEGKLIDEDSRRQLRRLLEVLVGWTIRLKAVGQSEGSAPGE